MLEDGQYCKSRRCKYVGEVGVWQNSTYFSLLFWSGLVTL